MSFRSQLSGKQYPDGEKPVKTVVETRLQTYTNKDGKVSHGWEIVREVLHGEDEDAGNWP